MDKAISSETGNGVVAEGTGSEIAIDDRGSEPVVETGSGTLLRGEESVVLPTETLCHVAHAETGSDVAPMETGSDVVPMETGSDVAKTRSEWVGSSLEGLPPAGLVDKADSQLLNEESGLGEGDGWEWDVIDDSSEGAGEAGSEGDEGLQPWVCRCARGRRPHYTY